MGNCFFFSGYFTQFATGSGAHLVDSGVGKISKKPRFIQRGFIKMLGWMSDSPAKKNTEIDMSHRL